MKTTFKNPIFLFILMLVFTPIAFILMPLIAAMGVVAALVLLIAGLSMGGEHHHA